MIVVPKPDNPLCCCEHVLVSPGISQLWAEKKTENIANSPLPSSHLALLSQHNIQKLPLQLILKKKINPTIINISCIFSQVSISFCVDFSRSLTANRTII